MYTIMAVFCHLLHSITWHLHAKKRRIDNRFIYIVIAQLLMVVAVSGLAEAEVISGKVKKVIDGDSILLRTGRTTHEIRLWGVDSPEYDQPHGSSAAAYLRKKIDNRHVRVNVKNRDSYGRLVGIVYIENRSVNRDLVRKGKAWVYSRYCRDSICTSWKRDQKAARKRKVGLWESPEAVPPWRWRRTRR